MENILIDAFPNKKELCAFLLVNKYYKLALLIVLLWLNYILL